MAKYRKISPRFWNDAKVRKLSENSRYAMLFTLTHPSMTPFGAIRANFPGLGYELGWSGAKFKKAIMGIVEAGKARVDEEASFIWFPNFMKYNQPESPNVIRSWSGAFEDMPECPLRNEMLAALYDLAVRLGAGYADAFSEAFTDYLDNTSDKPFVKPSDNPSGKPSVKPSDNPSGKGKPNQEQEQEQEQELNTEEDSSEASSEPTLPQSYDPVLIRLPIVGNSKVSEVGISQSQLDYWESIYPGVDIGQQLRNMLGWLNANSDRRKTEKGLPRFINRWLARAQDQASAARASPAKVTALMEYQKRQQENRDMALMILQHRQQERANAGKDNLAIVGNG